jgi:thioredoxin
MNFREKLIHYQNKAEENFQHKKSIDNAIHYFLAFCLFMASTLFAGLTMPVRLLFKSKTSNQTESEVIATDKTNIAKILQQNGLVLIDFWAEWCGPCILMNPVLKEFAAENPGICIAKLNVDTNKKIADQYKVRGIPLMVLIKNGKEVKRHAGPMTKADLEEFCFG